MEQWREDVLIHYGVKGMKWGIRRYLNKVGDRSRSFTKNVRNKYDSLNNKQKKALKIGAVAVASALAVSGAVAIKRRSHYYKTGKK